MPNYLQRARLMGKPAGSGGASLPFPALTKRERAVPPGFDPVQRQRCSVSGYTGSHLVCDVTQGDTTQCDALHREGRCPQEAYTPWLPASCSAQQVQRSEPLCTAIDVDN